MTTMVSTIPEILKRPDALGWTPLHYAALRGNLEATRVLVQQDSSIAYILENSGLSPLHVAAYAGHLKVVEELIRCRPDTCDLVNHNGQTVLHAAVLGGRINVVKFILKTPKLAGLINEADKDGNTPLHLAAIHQNRIIIRILTQDRRVDMFAINKESSVALDMFLGDNVGQQVCAHGTHTWNYELNRPKTISTNFKDTSSPKSKTEGTTYQQFLSLACLVFYSDIWQELVVRWG